MTPIQKQLLAIGSVLMFIAALGTSEAQTTPGDEPVRYHVTITPGEPATADVTVTLLPADLNFYMFPGAEQFPRRWSEFVSNIQFTDRNNRTLPFSSHADGSWQLQDLPAGPITLRYTVNVTHEEHHWSSGVDGAAYVRDWGIFFAGRALFIANGSDRRNLQLSFDIPDGWIVTTPWQESSAGANVYSVANHDVLATSILFAGTHKEVPIDNGPFAMLLALGGDALLARGDEFIGLATGVLDYYSELMGDTPRLAADNAARPVVVINEYASTDGEALGNNISLLLAPDADPMAAAIARLIFAHELYHLWNGKSFAPESDNAEWFKEGFSNLYTLKALRQTGYLDDDGVLQILAGAFYARYNADDAVGRLSMTDGSLKHDHWGLIYGGGLLVAIAQDLAIRTASDNKRSVDDLMRQLFNEYGAENYDIADLERLLSELNGSSQADFFTRYISGVERVPIADYLALAGIETLEEDGQTRFRIKADLSTAEAALLRGLLGGYSRH